jgi:hypothetical protein
MMMMMMMMMVMMMMMMCAFVRKKHTQAKAIRPDVNTRTYSRLPASILECQEKKDVNYK